MVSVVACHAGDLDSNPVGPEDFSPWNYYDEVANRLRSKRFIRKIPGRKQTNQRLRKKWTGAVVKLRTFGREVPGSNPSPVIIHSPPPPKKI